MRPIAEELYGIPRDRVIGSSTALEARPSPILGAAAVHGILLGWRHQLQGGHDAEDAAHDEHTPATDTIEQPVEQRA